MARIRPYESQASPLGQVPTQQAQLADVGGPGLENVGQALTQSGAAGAHAYQLLQAQEDANATTKVHVAMAEMANRATQELSKKKATADPADPDFFNTVYRGGVAEGEEPATGSLHDQLNKLREQVTNPVAQRRFETEAAALTHQVLVQATAFQGHLAGVHAKQQAIQLTNQLQAMVQTDPSQHTNALALMTAAVNDPQGIFYRPGMDAGSREIITRSMTEQISSSTVRGMIGDSPQHALHSLQSGEWDAQITGEQKIVLAHEAERQINGLEADARRKEAEGLKQKKDHSDTLNTMLLEQELLNHVDGKQRPVGWSDVLKASGSGMSGEHVQYWTAKLNERANRITTGEVKTDISTKLSLFKRIGLPPGHPDKLTSDEPITKAYLDRKLSDADHDWLVRKHLDAKSPDGDKLSQDFSAFFRRVPEQAILKPGPFGIYADTSKGGWYDKYVNDVEAMKQQYIKAGKDPRDLINPKKPEYVGSHIFIDQYANQEFGKWPDLAQTQPAPVPATGTPPRKSLDEIFGGKP